MPLQQRKHFYLSPYHAKWQHERLGHGKWGWQQDCNALHHPQGLRHTQRDQQRQRWPGQPQR